MVVVGLHGLVGSGVPDAAKIISKLFHFKILKVSELEEGFEKELDRLQISDNCIAFPCLSSAVDYAMDNWSENFVMIGLSYSMETLEIFKRRPTFFLIQISAPILHRFERCDADSLEKFVGATDHETGSLAYHEICHYSKMNIVNNGSREALEQAIMNLNLTSKIWLRPAWDQYFMKLADLASSRSNCMKRRVGAIIVKDSKVIATGYNGTPRGLPNCCDNGCPRCNRNTKCGQSLDDCICLHAEENAMLEAGTNRTIGATLYSTSTPCLGCAKKIVQCRFSRVVFEREYSLEHNVKDMFDRAGIQLDRVNLPHANQLILSPSTLP